MLSISKNRIYYYFYQKTSKFFMQSIKISKGDIIDIIFPATCCNYEDISLIKKYVESELELTPRIILEDQTTPTIKENYENAFPSYSPEKRFKQLYQSLSSNSKIVWCARGGYGSGDLLPFLDKAKKVQQNKLFIGFSDITSIASFLQEKWGWEIIVAPVLIQLTKNKITQDAVSELKDLIFFNKAQFNYQLIALNDFAKNKIIETEICGGCLSVLAGHFGGKYQINFNDKILFLEDQGEDGERLDRYFRQIIEVIQCTKQKPKAILLGNFMESNSSSNPKLENVRIAIKLLIQRIEQFNLKIPVLEDKNKNLGHSKKMRPILLGKKVKITPNKVLQLTI